MLKFASFDVVFREIPDEVTLAINISNCPNRCDGCHSPWLREDVGENLTDDLLIKLLQEYNNNITCVCFMGGDCDPLEVARLAQLIHQSFPTLNIGWYSGVQELPLNFPYRQFQYIKLGGYHKELGDLTSSNSNQRLYHIDNKGNMIDITYLFRK